MEVGDEEAEQEDEEAEGEAGEHGGGQLEVGGGREVVVVAVVVVGGDSFDGVPGGGFEVQGLLLALGLGVHEERDDEAVTEVSDSATSMEPYSYFLALRNEKGGRERTRRAPGLPKKLKLKRARYKLSVHSSGRGRPTRRPCRSRSPRISRRGQPRGQHRGA